MRARNVAGVCLLLVGLAEGVGSGCESSAVDPWASGYALEGWDRIAALQRYPILDEKPPDWQAVSRDKDPLVRTAAAMAIARAPDAALIPVLRPMLTDEHPLVRYWALRALLEIRSPLIREPLLEVIADWKDFKDLLADDWNASMFIRVGLPFDIATRPLQDRRQWVKEFAPAWTMNTDEPVYEWGVWFKNTVCPKESEIDAGEPIILQFNVSVSNPRKSSPLSLGTSASWRPVDADGRTTAHDVYDLRLHIPDVLGEPKREKIELKEGPNGPFDLSVLKSHRPPPPGIYLFETLDATMLIRVRRSAEFEKTIPKLLKPPLDAETAKTLGQKRVLAAVGPLMKAFAAGGGSGPMGRAAAGALGRIGDPAAAPLLLDHPLLRDKGMFGDTSGALKAFGKAAWPEYEKRILSWRGRLSGERAYSLAMALRLLGPNGSAAVERARQEMITALAADIGSGRERRPENPKRLVLLAAVGAIAPKQPDRVVEVIGGLAARPQLAGRLLREVGNKRCPPPVKEQIVRGLRALLKSKPGDDPLRSALIPLLSRMAPQVFAAEPSQIFSEKEALAAIQAAMAPALAHKTPSKALRRLREETADRIDAWLRQAAAPSRDMMRFRLALAPLYLAVERYEACERLLDVAEEEIKEKSRKVVAAAFRGLALKGLGRFDEAQASLKWAVDHLDSSTGYSYIHESDIRRRYWEVWWMPRRDDLRIRTVYLQGMESTIGNLRLWGSRIFGADAGFRLKAGDPLSEEESIWATMSQSPRDLAPLDERRVFVALKDRTAALYEEGKEHPIWKRPFSLAPESYLSAGPIVITAAEEDGTLHALDPATGKTLWTRKVLTSPWTVQSSCHTTLLRQADGVVLVPDKRLTPTQLECVDAATGKSLWTVPGIDRLSEVAVGQGLVVLGGPPGHVRALERGTGRPVFEVDLCPELKEKHDRVALAMDPAGRHVYAAVRDRVWALDAATGHTLWQWTWQARKATNPPARPYQPTPMLYPAEGGLFALFNWSEPHRDFPPPGHVDVVRFTADGTVVLHETSPHPRGQLDAFVAGNRLAIRRGTTQWEIWEFLPPAP